MTQISKIPTAEEFLNDIKNITYSQEEIMITFAKIHVEAALKAASDKAKMKDLNEDCLYEDEYGNYPDVLVIDKQSVLNAYPLENIK